jgi:xanthine/uracil/vitamin C permease (AzgA family)
MDISFRQRHLKPLLHCGDRFEAQLRVSTAIVLQLDILGALTWGFFAVILTIVIMDFLDTMATLIGLSARADFLDQDGNLPQI